jgi:hypothetical protein
MSPNRLLELLLRDAEYSHAGSRHLLPSRSSLGFCGWLAGAKRDGAVTD